jgi:hypothetical protein
MIKKALCFVAFACTLVPPAPTLAGELRNSAPVVLADRNAQPAPDVLADRNAQPDDGNGCTGSNCTTPPQRPVGPVPFAGPAPFVIGDGR